MALLRAGNLFHAGLLAVRAFKAEQLPTRVRHLDRGRDPPLITANVRWRRVVFENIFPWSRGQEIFQRGKFANAEYMHIYGMDDEPKGMDWGAHGGYATFNVGAGTVELVTHFPDESALLSYAQPAPDQLILDGVLRGRKIHAQMRLLDTSKFYLVTHANKLELDRLWRLPLSLKVRRAVAAFFQTFIRIEIRRYSLVREESKSGPQPWG